MNETAAVSAQSLCTPYNHAPYHFMQSHIRKVHACLAVTCYLHFWHNDQGLLHVSAVTRGWNGYRNKSQHRKLTQEKKILPPLLQGFEPVTFRSRVRRSNHRTIPAGGLSFCPETGTGERRSRGRETCDFIPALHLMVRGVETIQCPMSQTRQRGD